MIKPVVGTLALLATLGAAGSLQAQASPVSVDLRAGMSLPSGLLGENVDSGLALSGDVIYRVSPLLGVYLGYNLNHYAYSSISNATTDVRGPEAGLRLEFPDGGITPFFRGGVIYQQRYITGDGENFTGDSEFGVSVGGGVEVPIVPRFSFTPQASFSLVGDSRYVNLQAGLRIKL
jgi:hypothetical protein